MATPKITTPPSGYSIQRGSMWILEEGRVHHSAFSYLRDTVRAFKLDTDGRTVVFDDARLAEFNRTQYRIEFIPDSQLPDPPSAMTWLHTSLNSTTGRYEKPNILDAVRLRHEGDRDFDVRAAQFDFHNSQNRTRFMRFIRDRATAGLSGAELTRVRALYQAEIDTYNAMRGARLEYAFDIVLTEALIDSLHRVEQDDDDEQPVDTARRWHDWAQNNATAICDELMRRNALASTASGAIHDDHLADYVAQFAATLTADGALPAGDTGRTWPRAVRFVAALATGDAADATERTLDSAMTLIKAKVLPPEGPGGSDDDDD